MTGDNYRSARAGHWDVRASARCYARIGATLLALLAITSCASSPPPTVPPPPPCPVLLSRDWQATVTRPDRSRAREITIRGTVQLPAGIKWSPVWDTLLRKAEAGVERIALTFIEKQGGADGGWIDVERTLPIEAGANTIVVDCVWVDLARLPLPPEAIDAR